MRSLALPIVLLAAAVLGCSAQTPASSAPPQMTAFTSGLARLPLTSAAATWRTVDEQVLARGEKQVSVSLPWEALELTAYPTNFAKKIDGKQTNSSHVVHVRRLREAAAETGGDGLTSYADPWEGYMCDWRSLPIYQALHVRTLAGFSPVSDVPGCDGSGSAVPTAEQMEEQGG